MDPRRLTARHGRTSGACLRALLVAFKLATGGMCPHVQRPMRHLCRPMKAEGDM